MKNVFVLLLLIPFLISTAAAQNERQLITVQGTGTVKALPDIVILSAHITSSGDDFNQVVSSLNSKSNTFVKELKRAGFREEQIETLNYNVNRIRNWEDGKMIEGGYEGRQYFSVEFPFDQEMLIETVRELSESKSEPEFNFGFTLSDDKRKELQEQLLSEAVKDARENAAILADASGVKLGPVNSITYNKQNFRMPMQEMQALKSGDTSQGEFTGFNVREIELTDNVVVVWELR